MTNTAQTLDIQQRAKVKRELIANGVNPSGMNDQELLDAQKDLHGPKTEPKPEKRQRGRPKAVKTEEKPNDVIDFEAPATTQTSKDSSALAETIAALLSNQSGLDEARVIELIKQHAPKPKLITITMTASDYERMQWAKEEALTDFEREAHLCENSDELDAAFDQYKEALAKINKQLTIQGV